MSVPLSTIACAGCGTVPAASDAYPFRCRNAGHDDVDHVLVRSLDLAHVRFPAATCGESNPFLRYRGLLNSYHRATAAGMTDEAFSELVRQLDRRVAQVDGHGLGPTPFQRDEMLSAKLGFCEPGGLWVKDETGNVAGSHKGRHLTGVLLHLELAGLGLAGSGPRPQLAIASCGNAALAAAVLAKAGNWPLRVFVPVNAEPGVVARLSELGAEVISCPRQPGQSGDPAYHRLLQELESGALPFSCQGNLNGLAIEGGQTLGYEMVSDLRAIGLALEHVVVQVGGGALATACMRAFEEAGALGVLPSLPAMHTVQTEGAHPLERAYHQVRAKLPPEPAATDVQAAMAAAASHRSEYMWPWESEPKSMATGILDDETYDWRAVVEGMLRSGGRPVVVSEDRIAEAHRLGMEAGYPVDPTGTASLAGLLDLRASGVVGPQDRTAVLFTGLQRSGS